jgi:hypothetical protein
MGGFRLKLEIAVEVTEAKSKQKKQGMSVMAKSSLTMIHIADAYLCEPTMRPCTIQ